MSAAETAQQHQLFINGQWTEPSSGQYFDVINPATGEIVGKAAIADDSDVTKAIEASHRVFPEWAAKPAAERARTLRKLQQLFLENKDQLARTVSLETGKPLQQALMEVNTCAEYLLWNAEEGRRVYGETIPAGVGNKRLKTIRQPVGPVAAITPWNFPLSMVIRKIAPALAAGCTVVLKPAELTPGSAAQVCRLAEQAGVPAGVLNMVTGNPAQIGNVLLSDKRIRKVTFTGSTPVGKLLLKQAADQVKKVSMELGGHAPFIVFEDADIEKAIAGITQVKFFNCGQTCICPNRIFVQNSIKDKFIALFKEKVQGLKVGNGIEGNVDVGPLINQAGLDKVSRHVEDAVVKGATLVVGGEKLTGENHKDGFFYSPTILSDIKENMLVSTEETFGPVASILTFETEQEVIDKANSVDVGLAAYFFTNDLSRSIRVSEALQYGMVGINDTALAQVEIPFGGVKESGMGREGGPGTLDDFLDLKLIATTI
ncbi:NAD-dependent succinate-semialdehyde dehydrogenase [Paenibacillus eucommiae]|uniref:Aldehyde dehydrogenase n=1 Tax=Paenibacillus eucommiae TaxID=1355755 RepID=A0ABS4J819_9BACL|nr:NAD-dependent succinate-semialdehyde dehydrogenase [Paenibacillus eucommiae]MBP1995395.1 succinate-semialdehyde dehydrogenase/glutarate-semialdehyde dehydrogenase [Paenibacillus eucommiae]